MFHYMNIEITIGITTDDADYGGGSDRRGGGAFVSLPQRSRSIGKLA